MSGSSTANGNTQGRTLSRIGRKPIPIPQGVEVEVQYGGVVVKGPNGTLTQTYHPDVKVTVEDGNVLVERLSERKFHHALHGLTRSLIANAVQGVSEGYTKTLELMGVGYRVQQVGDGIVLWVGHSHTIEMLDVDIVSIQRHNVPLPAHHPKMLERCHIRHTEHLVQVIERRSIQLIEFIQLTVKERDPV